MDIRKGDGIVLKSGSRMLVESQQWNRRSEEWPDWRVAAWTEDHEYRFPIQLIAIVEVWRNGKRVDNQPVVEQMSMFGDLLPEPDAV